MEGHHAVFHGQGALAVAGFIGVEHTAVGLEISGIYAVRQGSLSSGRGNHHGGSSHRACCSRGGGDSPAAACQRSSQHHTGQRNDDKLFATHKINTSVS